MNSNLKLAVLALCGGADSGAAAPGDPDQLELIICDVGALQAVAADHTRTPVALPHQRPNRIVRASRTFMDWRDNQTVAEELAERYHGTLQETLEPFYCVAAFPLMMAERILPEYFLKPMDRAVAAAVAA
ncbi:MAG: hypothetical protein FJ398_13775 [Verrucomicrobia bacterium]|nr:hypothetical protein [Verrucomicrobiota bacterium]